MRGENDGMLQYPMAHHTGDGGTLDTIKNHPALPLHYAGLPVCTPCRSVPALPTPGCGPSHQSPPRLHTPDMDDPRSALG